MAFSQTVESARFKILLRAGGTLSRNVGIVFALLIVVAVVSVAAVDAFYSNSLIVVVVVDVPR